MSISHLKLSQSALVGFATTLVGLLVAVIPQWSGDKQLLISASSAGIGAVFMIVNAIHTLVASKVSGKDLEGDVTSFVESELEKLNINGLVHGAVSEAQAGQGLDIKQAVSDELHRLLVASGLEAAQAKAAADAPVVEAAPVAVVDPTAPAVPPVA